MSVSYVEREQASPEALAFYDKAEGRFEMLLNIFKVFGHTPELERDSRRRNHFGVSARARF